jgi:hypothetical protein
MLQLCATLLKFRGWFQTHLPRILEHRAIFILVIIVLPLFIIGQFFIIRRDDAGTICRESNDRNRVGRYRNLAPATGRCSTRSTPATVKGTGVASTLRLGEALLVITMVADGLIVIGSGSAGTAGSGVLVSTVCGMCINHGYSTITKTRKWQSFFNVSHVVH